MNAIVPPSLPLPIHDAPDSFLRATTFCTQVNVRGKTTLCEGDKMRNCYEVFKRQHFAHKCTSEANFICGGLQLKLWMLDDNFLHLFKVHLECDLLKVLKLDKNFLQCSSWV